jgi:hypothetical protein
MTEQSSDDERILASSLSIYTSRDQRAAMRGGMSDAAALCDVIARQIVIENTSRGALTKLGKQLEAVAKRCGDDIWAMRSKVAVPLAEAAIIKDVRS